MNRIAIFLLSIAAGGALAWMVAVKNQEARFTTLLAAQQASWDKEKAALEAALQSQPKQAVKLASSAMPVEPAARQMTPSEIIANLKDPRLGTSPRGIRAAIYNLETLIAAGTNALPAIREFLAENKDIPYDFAGGKGMKHSRLPTDFLVPPSLRFGLFDAAKQIGGPDAEKLLADMLQTTGSGMEVAWLAKTLQEMAPDKYRDTALAVARDLLTHPVAGGSNDKYERDFLYGVLSTYNDASLVSQSQAQLIAPDGQIDRSALRYIQQTLGEQSLPIAMQAYNDPRVDPAKKETLARIGLYYAGDNPQANQLFDAAVHNESLSVDARRNFIEDLNQDGISNQKNPTPEDQKIIEARIKLIQSYYDNGGMNQPILNGALNEAMKDLQGLLQKMAQSSATPHQ
ncbi:hypothetical protein [Pedosphaera parvula]|uniref:Uncharacterized protein n=1 Tax=Pedosphaera parvula (strain Ellin514) TaxID=320771 RepID=B9XED5_PEDPL|nr:hypothetical protein [Pedosphaera parvula]EEF61649.1 hypothetical protein Cflav_PD4689 [Pedosphaera parvula Ellin514]